MKTSAKLSLPPSVHSVGSSTGAAAGSKSISINQLASEEISRLQQDLVLLTQRVADLSGEPQRAPVAPALEGPTCAPNSPFVSGLRGMAEGASATGGGSGAVNEIKLNMLEKVLKKVAEMDRLLLKKTAPEGDSARINARRGSRGMDLFSMPTHLHVTDRLLDLHAQSKRVVTVTKSASGIEPESEVTQPRPPNQPGPISPRPPASTSTGSLGDKEATKKAVAELAALKVKFDESEEKRSAIKEDCASARKENLLFKKEIEALRSTVETLQQAAGQDDKEARIRALEAQVIQLQSQAHQLQEHLEVELSRSAKAVEVVTQRAAAIKNNNQEYGNSPLKGSLEGRAVDSQENLLGEPMAHALRLLQDSLKGRLASMHEQLLSMNIVKETLETDVQTLQMAQDIVNKDFLSVQHDLEALRAAHSALQAESMNNDAALKLERANNLLLDLQAEVAAAHRRTYELERLPAVVAELESKLRTLESKTIEQSGEINVLNGELDSYKKMSEGLKKKIKELSGKSDSRDFMDSFEEVMQDEMYTMKLAFEAKLKAKADEVAALSNRHALEISKMQVNASPYVRR